MPKPTEADKEAYKRYLDSLPKNEKGEVDIPIHPSAVNAASEDLALGKKTGYAVFGDELDKKAKFAGMPEGELRKTKLTEKEIHKATEFFEQAAPFLTEWIDKGFINTKPGITLEEEIKDITGRLEAKQLTEQEIAAYPQILLILNKLKTYEIPGETETYNLLEEIHERGKILNEILDHKRKTQI